MAAPQPRRFPLPRSNLGAVSESAPPMDSPTDGETSPGAESQGEKATPARGREMRADLLSKLRTPPLVHSWDFWHDKPDPAAQAAEQNQGQQQNQSYKPVLTKLLNVADVRTFWSMFNNFDFGGLAQHNSVHLFHTTVEPVWEDPRNARGGAWTFRVPRAAAVDFWQNVCLLAIGEQLQQAVQSDRVTFKDDICGVSYRPRFTSVLITIWNRDGSHEQGIKRLAETVISNMPDHLTPKEGSYYYKKHSDHPGFDHDLAKKNLDATASDAQPITQQLDEATDKHGQVRNSVDGLAREMANLKAVLEKVEGQADGVASKLDSQA